MPRISILLFSSLLFSCGVIAGDHDHQKDPSIHVSGQAEVRVMPDQATVPMSVEERSPDLEFARRKVTETVERFLKLTDDLGIARKYVDTAQLQVRPEYDWNNKTRQRRLVGYFVSRRLTVDLRDLGLLGALMERATDAGVNNSQGARYDSSQRDHFRREALKIASANARADAEATAAGLNARIGKALTVRANSPQNRPSPVHMQMARSSMAMDESGGAAETYSAGEIVFNANVQVEFELID